MNQFPYTNFHDVNLDWLLKQTKENTTDISNFESEITTINSEIDALQNEIENISSLYLCTFGVTTNSEIETALNDKKLPICIYNGHIYVISQRVSANRHRFGSVYRTESEALECLLDSWLTQSDTFASTTYVNTQIANAAELFWAEYGVTSPAEIHAANAAGKVCALIYGNSNIYYLVSDDGDDGIYFGSPLGEGSQSWILVTGNPTTWDLPVSRKIPIASNVTPMPLGTVSPGTQLEYSRRDHVHPMPDAGKIPYDENENYSSGTVGNELNIGYNALVDNFTPTEFNNIVPLNFEAQPGYYASDGTFRTFNNIDGATINVKPGERYLLSSYSYYEVARAVFWDENEDFISSVWTAYDSAFVPNTLVIVPDTAKTMLIQKLNIRTAELKSATKYVILQESILKDKNITVIGDSITEYNWRAKTNWAMYINEWAGAIIQNLGSSGTGFVNTDPYINRISNIQQFPDIIGVAASFNDLSSGLPIGTVTDTGTTTICGYINDFFDALITAYPTTPIICYCQGVWSNAKPGNTNSDNYINSISQICELKGIPFYDGLYKGSVLRPWNASNQNIYYNSDNTDLGNTGVIDNVHPNSEGHKVIARYLYPKFMENLVETGLNYNIGGHK